MGWFKIIFTLYLAAAVLAAPGSKISYKGHQVLRFVPKNGDDLLKLQKFKNENHELDFWKDPSKIGIPVDIRVSPQEQNLVKDLNMEYEVFIEDVQSLIDLEKKDNRPTPFALDWSDYYDIDEINAWLDSVVKAYPNLVSPQVAATSFEGRELKGVKVTFGPSNPEIFIEAGIHAREWISPATATYLLNLILTDQTIDRKVVESYNWYIFPSFNPDGYHYTHTNNRLWRKTRSGSGLCRGADPNRNWPYHWMNGGASDYPCDETYAGSGPASESEISGAVEYLKQLTNLEIYISLHSYSQLLMFPWGDTYDRIEDYDTLYRVGINAANALKARYGTQFEVGSISETIYIASGSSVDWVKGVLATPLSYTYELRDTGRYGFLLPPSQIIPTAEETSDSILSVAKDGLELLRAQKGDKYPQL